MESLFRCPICGKGLERLEKAYRCPDGHSFDIAREGYVNLLPANFQHSKAPGDDKDMAAARTRFLDGGWYGPLRDELCKLIDELSPPSASLLDAGCGEGWYTQVLGEHSPPLGGAIPPSGGRRVAGIDLSKPAVKKAARRCPHAELAVGTLYHLPVADGAIDLLLNCFSPLAIGEFRRVVKPGGWFLYVVPGPRHLWELKEVLYDTPYENEEKREEYDGFTLRNVVPVETVFTLPTSQDIQDLFCMTPYYWKTPKEGTERLSKLDRLTVTGQFRIHCYERNEAMV